MNDVASRLKLACCVSTKIKDGLAVMPKRCVVESTFAWIGNFGRLSKDYEILAATAENNVRLGKLCRDNLKQLIRWKAYLIPKKLAACFLFLGR